MKVRKIMVEFCDLKLCEECNEEFSSTYMKTENLCRFCWASIKEQIHLWKDWKVLEGGETND